MKPFFYLGRQVGFLKPDGVFITYRRPEHYFRKYAGFGLSFGVLKELWALECKKIKILYEKEPGITMLLESTPRIFLEQGIYYSDGEDAQRILPIKLLAQEELGGFLN